MLLPAQQSLPSLPARPNFAVDAAAAHKPVFPGAYIPASPGTPTSEVSEVFLPNEGFQKLQGAWLDLPRKEPRDFSHLLPPLSLEPLAANEQAEARLEQLSPGSLDLSTPGTFLDSPVATRNDFNNDELAAYMDTQVQEDALFQGGHLVPEQDCLSHVWAPQKLFGILLVESCPRVFLNVIRCEEGAAALMEAEKLASDLGGSTDCTLPMDVHQIEERNLHEGFF